jgi:hypothetical protein
MDLLETYKTCSSIRPRDSQGCLLGCCRALSARVQNEEIEGSLLRLQAKALNCYAKLPTNLSLPNAHRLIICNGLLEARLRRLDRIIMGLVKYLGGEENVSVFLEVIDHNCLSASNNVKIEVLDPHLGMTKNPQTPRQTKLLSLWPEIEAVCGREKLTALRNLWKRQHIEL